MGRAGEHLLLAVAKHPSRASSSYYHQYFVQYFGSMLASLTEIRRVSAPGAQLVIVARDSYYKEIHIDLPAMLGEIAQGLGWTVDRIDFPSRVSKAAIHPHSANYRTSHRAMESALFRS